ncbi:MAG: bifunctional methylenetetrahydrofolate dehydrogenase/methenyltetrahydrofolate cyclohydrolase [Alphaproteobacteria bacterium]|nr:bifunctional methylenetetrahydrofolate dehydrogenase/methenyltetrahydrofolate cyclohydrolase [Alphaproteobacteria bacterium]
MKQSNIIDGKEIAKSIIDEAILDIKSLKSKGITPGLAVIIVGNDPGSKIYVARKREMALKLGMKSFALEMPTQTDTKEIIDKIKALNEDSSIHGILVQLPLPKHIDTASIIDSIDPKKDVDGFTLENVGKLVTRQKGLKPCTPQGCLHLIKTIEPNLKGLHAVVIGRSNIVGKPVADMLLHENCTVTTIHSKTKHPEKIAKTADIIIAAAGSPELVDEHWVKEGAIVIDVGISRATKNGKTTLLGDVNFQKVQKITKAITPVPGGVGPMTISYLLKNTVKAAYNSLKNK